MSNFEKDRYSVISMLIKALRDAVIYESDQSSSIRGRQVAWSGVEYAINKFVELIITKEKH